MQSITITDPKTKQVWRMRYIATGDKYGRDDCLTHDKEPMVEFYDMARALTVGERGQFVTRYYIYSLHGDVYNNAYVDKGNRRGLDLMGYEPTWKVSAPMMDLVMSWLTEVERLEAITVTQALIDRIQSLQSECENSKYGLNTEDALPLLEDLRVFLQRHPHRTCVKCDGFANGTTKDVCCGVRIVI